MNVMLVSGIRSNVYSKLYSTFADNCTYYVFFDIKFNHNKKIRLHYHQGNVFILILQTHSEYITTPCAIPIHGNYILEVLFIVFFKYVLEILFNASKNNKYIIKTSEEFNPS